MIPVSTSEDYSDVIGRLLVRVYEIHKRVLVKGGGGLKAAALFHSLIKSHPFMDGTKRTAFASAIYFLNERGYPLQRPLPKDEVVRFCVQVAEEAARQAEGEAVRPKTIPEIAA